MITPPADEFWEAIKAASFHRQDGTSQGILSATASQWREEENHFAAGFAMQKAMYGAWGDPEEMYSIFIAAVHDFENCVNSQPPESHASLAALLQINSLLRRASWMFGIDRTKLRVESESVFEELGQRLISYYKNSPRKVGYLVTGVNLRTDLASSWEPTFPEYEVTIGEEQWGGGFLTLNLPSAFQIFVQLGDYEGANDVITECPEGFATPGLRGWKAAVQGLMTPSEAPEKFAEAADAFAGDRLPVDENLRKTRGSWSSINVDLWAKYFRSRSTLALAIRNPERVRELIREAADALQGTEWGWHDPRVSKFGILVQCLAHLIGEEPGLTPEDAQKKFLSEVRLSGDEEHDPAAMRFFALASESFDGFRADPAKEITTGKLSRALDALAQIPLIGPELTEIVTPVMGERAYEEVLGQNRTWIYRTLESIGAEVVLQKLLLRLLEAQLPLYAQILHGPLEYGKDVVVLLEEDGQRVLRMYQLKCGNISQPVWRNASSELEEMFLVPLSDLQVPEPVDVRKGILLTNGHANSNVTPVMDGWFKEQREVHKRDIEFMHLDSFVQWIMKYRLINEFKAALNELGLEVII